MGLDSYLERVTETYERVGMTEQDSFGHYKITRVHEQIGYWRKFNALHAYIVENFANGIDECQRITLSRDNVWQILETLKQVVINPKEAPELLPTQSGFFFGGTDYDDWYFNDVKKSIPIFENALREIDDENAEIVYLASW